MTRYGMVPETLVGDDRIDTALRWSLLVAVAAARDARTGEARVSRAELAGRLRRHPKHIGRELSILERRGVLRRLGRGRFGIPELDRIRIEQGSAQGASKETREGSAPAREGSAAGAPEGSAQGAPPIRESEKKNQKARSSSEDLTNGIPEALDTPDFRAAWAEWAKHRREIGKKLTPLSVSRQLGTLAPLGAKRAIVAIEYSIERGWTGIFEPPSKHPGLPTQSNENGAAGSLDFGPEAHEWTPTPDQAAALLEEEASP